MNIKDIENNKHRKCIRCGQCMSVCPLYNVTGRELDVSRGKLSLIELFKQKEKNSKTMYRAFSRCLLCGACSQVCANKVPGSYLIREAKSQSKQNIKAKLLKVPVKTFTGNGLSSKIFRKGGSLLQGIIAKKIPVSSGLYLRFPMSSFINRCFIPEIESKPFLSSVNLKKITSNDKQNIGYFIGCGGNYLFHKTVSSVVNIFSKCDYNIIIPKDQLCCGLPAWCMGDSKMAISNAKKNIIAFENLNLDKIITSCASCGVHLKSLPLLFKKDSGWYLRAYKISSIVIDAMGYLNDNIERLKKIIINDSHKKISIFYHEPCHLRIGQGKTNAFFNLFNLFKNITIIDSEDHCCGHGGSFNVNHYDLSMKILDKRMKHLLSSNPDYVTTGCTGCELQLSDGISQHKLRARVCHPLTIIKEFLGDI